MLALRRARLSDWPWIRALYLESFRAYGATLPLVHVSDLLRGCIAQGPQGRLGFGGLQVLASADSEVHRFASAAYAVGDGVVLHWSDPQDWRGFVEGAWFLTAMAVAPQARGQGIGGRLIAERVAWAREAGAPAVWTTCVVGSGSTRLFEEAGFELVLSQGGYYDNGAMMALYVLPLGDPVPFTDRYVVPATVSVVTRLGQVAAACLLLGVLVGGLLMAWMQWLQATL